MDSTKNCHHGEEGCLKSEKNANVVYGLSPRWRSHTAFGRCVNPIAITRHITPLLDFYTFPWPCFVQCAEKYELETKNKKKKYLWIFTNFSINQILEYLNKKDFFKWQQNRFKKISLIYFSDLYQFRKPWFLSFDLKDKFLEVSLNIKKVSTVNPWAM